LLGKESKASLPAKQIKANAWREGKKGIDSSCASGHVRREPNSTASKKVQSSLSMGKDDKNSVAYGKKSYFQNILFVHYCRFNDGFSFACLITINHSTWKILLKLPSFISFPPSLPPSHHLKFPQNTVERNCSLKKS